MSQQQTQQPLLHVENENEKPQKKKTISSTLLLAFLAITVSTAFISGFLWVLDSSNMRDMGFVSHALTITINNNTLGDGNLSFFEIVFGSFILSILPILLFLVFSTTGIVIFFSLLLICFVIALAFLVPAGIFLSPLFLIIGIVWLVRRKTKSTQ